MIRSVCEPYERRGLRRRTDWTCGDTFSIFARGQTLIKDEEGVRFRTLDEAMDEAVMAAKEPCH